MRGSATDCLYGELELNSNRGDRLLPAGLTVRPLLFSDVEAVLQNESAGFPENERCSREKLEYRLTVCPELCLGVFSQEYEWPAEQYSNPYGVGASSSAPCRETLVGHILSTKTNTKFVTDSSMMLPTSADDRVRGHQEDGCTIAIHSVVVNPEWQGKQIGYSMMKDYMQRFFSLRNADRMSLLAKEALIPFYEKHGFHDHGVSECRWGGEEWHDLECYFDSFDKIVESD